MKVLIVGAGGREHALAWKLSQSPSVDALFTAPGNAGTAVLGTNWPGAPVTAAPQIVAKSLAEGIGLAVIGPEAALAAGLADALRAAGIPTFGPNRNGARLESSKAFAKQFMARHGIPTARFRLVHDLKQAQRQLNEWAWGSVVVKADGLAAGKGVVVCETVAEARSLLEGWYGERKVPGGGSTVVLEEALRGREASVMWVTDGHRAYSLAPACDYKRAGDGDTGPNTGGMGAYSPAADVLDDAGSTRIGVEIMAPALEGLRHDGTDYRGCLYAGVMVTADGPMLLEFNARFGDPETEVVLPRLESDLAALLLGCANGEVAEKDQPRFTSRACVGVVLATEGYPLKSEPVKGLPHVDGATFWGSSAINGETVDAAGGRVLTVTALGDTIADARAAAYASCGAYGKRLAPGTKLVCRSDIAARVPAD
ncbi:MAG TPA: phosphoribosylamine--glycine ligase [Candidatus Eremiobacteraceae bacterium]